MQTTLNSIERQATFLMMPMCSNLTCFGFKEWCENFAVDV